MGWDGLADFVREFVRIASFELSWNCSSGRNREELTILIPRRLVPRGSESRVKCGGLSAAFGLGIKLVRVWDRTGEISLLASSILSQIERKWVVRKQKLDLMRRVSPVLSRRHPRCVTYRTVAVEIGI